jgi:hypothetical protein
VTHGTQDILRGDDPLVGKRPGIATSHIQKARARVEPDDLAAARCEAIGDAPMPTCQIEHRHTRFETQQPPDQLDFAFGALGTESQVVEVEVVVGREDLVEIKRWRTHTRSPSGCSLKSAGPTRWCGRTLATR